MVQYIPTLTGPIVFVSILLAAHGFRMRRKAWLLGAAAQLGLITYGVLSGNLTFTSHALPALAFGINIFRDYFPKQWKRMVEPVANLSRKVGISRRRSAQR